MNKRDDDGYSPLFIAINKNNQSSFVELVQCGADWMQEGRFGQIPLLEAASRGFAKGMKLHYIFIDDN